jgi:hypothetical protein
LTVTSGFFNSLNGDRKYNAEQMSRYFDKIIGSGVIPNPANALQVYAGGGMNVQVMAGRGFVDCHWLDNDATETINVPVADAVLNRIDLVIMKLDLNESGRAVTLEVKKGTPAQNPVAPEVERSEKVKEYCLAQIYVAAKTNTIIQSMITDTRANTAVCGWVTSLIEQVDTGTLFVQWQDAYERYYNESTAAFDSWLSSKQRDFEQWYGTLTEDLQVGAYVKKYQRVENLTVEVNQVIVGIGDYESDKGDEVVVLCNNLQLIHGVDYTVEGTGAGALIKFTTPKRAGNTITVIVRKSLIGTNS